MNWNKIDQIIIEALNEDMPYGDLTTESIFTNEHQSKASLIAKEPGVIAGVDIFKRVMYLIDSTIECNFYVTDGEHVDNRQVLASISGPTKSILMGERVALNLMQRMSGVATLTNQFVSAIEGLPTRIVDTRKTTPNLRLFEKMAVKMGGGHNHRFNLSDAVMIKDNHIQAAGGIKHAVDAVRNNIPHTTKIEVEVENIEQLHEALAARVDIIMLDNMTTEMMKEAVILTNGRAILEASGNMNLQRVKEVAETGVDIISVGALTHSYRSLDISLKF